LPTYRLLIEYDGTDFAGWQVQPGQPSVQAALEDALATVARQPVSVVGSGRTDAGVHARGQAAHFELAAELDTHRLARSLNGLLPPTVAVLAAERAPDGFHARYDASRRLYHYHVADGPRALDRRHRLELRPVPDFELMNEAAAFLTGEHHFGAFCITQSATRNRVCTVELARWVPEPRPGDWRFEIAADRFLHGMVRAVVGTLLQIGRRRRQPEELRDILASRDRRLAGPAAPPHGLVLEHVTYDSGAGSHPNQLT
jgi:tRNA pseudouridine38-40 synthase